MLGNSDTPVIGSLRVSSFAWRAAQVAAKRPASEPLSTAATNPPAASISWKNAHAAAASSAVSASTYAEPAAGSATRPRLDSSARIDWVLRASRRPSSRSGRSISSS